MHARCPYAAGASSDYARHRGYEEGLAEGLARQVTHRLAGILPVRPSYEYYVVAYRALSRVLGLDVEQLWRALWVYPAGRVRDEFGRTVRAAVRQTSGQTLSSDETARLQGVADQLFQPSRVNLIPNEDALIALWRAAFR
jgi:hypothetical protein